ncbi:MAG: ABC transporter substrate-binding protein [Armatimonadota bacterium]|nr:ABC transporter substrate-binding protein [Armatimonadota bacterium]MDR7450316.1 ABC transporter substrate-binding protein [Armatimonadota bacterium]MDR7467101.1 ABC transporter substrate-binding protein [Armatimonadota bacterium]MDR7493357.1 ABC transporter substrate-binding protein [Armatimonadota bacterium]MDR7499365.1 ABC transporter substrate-binding protein [Armatimonadota bacterium]
MQESSDGKWVQVAENRWRRINRREFLKLTAGAAGAAAAAGSFGSLLTTVVRAQQRELRIMTWSHFVPAFDAWFDPWAERWGQSKNIRVTVDHISFADIVPRANAEVAAQAGHDLFFFLSPPSAFEQQVLDLSDINREAERRYGPMVPLVRKSTYNANTRKFFGFSDNWVPDPGDYLKSVWTAVGFPNGPASWDDLLTGGRRIKERFREIQIPIGIGFSQDIDSNMATHAILWSFGASEQDADENVTLNSEETIRAVEFGATLFRETMNPAVLSWNAASNNQALNARQTSYILNSISAYRTAQDNRLPVADDINFVGALRGPRARWASEHVMGVWVIWRFARNPDNAKQFLLDLVDNYRDAVIASKLYNFPSFMGSVAPKSVPVAQKPDEGRKWVRAAVLKDPFGSNPVNKLAVLADAEAWSTNPGHPGPANPAIGEIFDTFVIPDMFAKAATGQLTARQAVAEADRRVKEIFAKWRRLGLVGGGGRDR